MGFNWMLYTFIATTFVLIDGQDDYNSDLYKTYEEALVTDESNLYNLQKTFFNPSISESASSVTVNASVREFPASGACERVFF